MFSSKDFLLPDVGEGLTEAEIVQWHVVVGGKVEINDVIVEIETAKSMVELPSPFAGTVSAIHVDAGVTVDVGTVLISIQEVGHVSDDRGLVTDPSSSKGPESSESAEIDEPKPLVLVGTGPKDPAARRRRIGKATDVRVVPVAVSADNPVRAKPPLRALAKQLGVDLEQLAAHVTGVITRSDVESAVRTPAPLGDVAVQASSTPERSALETRIPIKGVRKATAAAMSRSAFTAPHVTEWVAVDVTATMEAVSRLKKDFAWAGVRINPMLFVVRAYLLAIRNFPEINASWDAEAQEIILKHYVNLGIAAATPRGLIVPNIKDAHEMDLRTLAAALEHLVATARSGKTRPADMAKGTITITNIGALGVDAGTPILNPGESAILAFGAVRPMPWVFEGEVCVRQVAQLALSFDHRLIDGELGSKVLARVAALLNDPGASFLYAWVARSSRSAHRRPISRLSRCRLRREADLGLRSVVVGAAGQVIDMAARVALDWRPGWAIPPAGRGGG